MWQKLLGGRVRILVTFEEGIGFSQSQSVMIFSKVFKEKEDVVGREVQILEGSIQG